MVSHLAATYDRLLTKEMNVAGSPNKRRLLPYPELHRP